MNYIIFTYAGDSPALETSLRQIHSADDEAKIFLLNDGANPIPNPILKDFHQKKLIHTYEPTYFDRKRNLNGTECIRGMLWMMHKACTLCNFDHLIKIDSDTALINPSAIRESLDMGYLAGGCQASKNFAFTGICYWLTHTAIQDLLELFMHHPLPKPESAPEDITISQALLYLYGCEKVHLLTNHNSSTMCGINTTDPAQINQIAHHAITHGTIAAHCGQTEHYTALLSDELPTPRHTAAHVLKTFITALKTQHNHL